MKYYIMVPYRDRDGARYHVRLNMRAFRNLEGAKRLADSTRGAFVCPLGKVAPCYVGVWQ